MSFPESSCEMFLKKKLCDSSVNIFQKEMLEEKVLIFYFYQVYFSK